ncbi:sarcosine oxidase subunit delta [uncultured Tateyamaria sp.]|uniref:sarcosine oxidase subunit delta n=1 Tax=Tateyamaria sp. 1078 TaxID=3417464 RepID=UPI00262A1911|nr:sarcosine oxidase subunit delta [uncultured Tateyamaria sp.]
MRIPCPICGARDRREFYYQGAAVALARPAPDAGEAAWDDYLHLRENSAGDLDELWSHDAGCGAWLRVTRNVSSHEVKAAVLARDAS